MAAIREISTIEEWEKEWKQLEESNTKLRENEYSRLMTLMDEYHSAQGKLQKGMVTQDKLLKSFAYSLKKISKSDKSEDNKSKLLEMSEKIGQMNRNFDEMSQGLPKTAGWFLRACIGDINVSLQWSKLQYKNIYEKFKLRMMVISMIFTIFNLTVLKSRFFDALFNGIMVWYYSSLTLQEQILRANGSRIRGWWVVHHYLSILLSGFLLIWPDGVPYQLFRSQFYYFSFYLCFVQFLQYHYQSGVLYRLRALGLSSNMDTTAEGFKSWMLKGLGFLVPFLIFGYAFQLFNSYRLYQISKHPKCTEWQVLACSILFFSLAVGNFYTLLMILKQKSVTLQKIRLPCE